MTIEEAIEHAEDAAKRHECTECGREHQQLADWLKELRTLKEESRVIHCKDCKWFKEHFMYSEAYHTCERIFLNHFRVDNDGTGFCAWAERKSDGEI